MITRRMAFTALWGIVGQSMFRPTERLRLSPQSLEVKLDAFTEFPVSETARSVSSRSLLLLQGREHLQVLDIECRRGPLATRPAKIARGMWQMEMLTTHAPGAEMTH